MKNGRDLDTETRFDDYLLHLPKINIFLYVWTMIDSRDMKIWISVVYCISTSRVLGVILGNEVVIYMKKIHHVHKENSRVQKKENEKSRTTVATIATKTTKK